MNETNETENLVPPTTEIVEETPASLVTEPETSTTEPEVTPEPFVPLTTEDIVLPEGFTVDEELQTAFLEAMNNQELSPKDRANALIDLQAKTIAKASEASSAAWDNVQKEWRDEVKAKYGDNMVSTLSSVNKLITEYGNDKLTSVFNLTGAGNNVHMIEFLATLADKLTEGGPATGQPSGAGQNVASMLYPSMKG